MRQVSIRNILVETTASIFVLAAILPVYLDSLLFHEATLKYTSEFEARRASIFFEFWVCSYNRFYAGYTELLAFYLALITIFSLAVFRFSNFKVIISISYVIHLSCVSYVTTNAFDHSEGSIAFHVLLTTLLMLIAMVMYLQATYQRMDDQVVVKENELKVNDTRFVLSMVGSALLVIIYLILVQLNPFFESRIIGYSFVVTGSLITLPGIDQRSFHIGAIVALTFSLVNWWLAILGIVFVSVLVTTAHDRMMKKINRKMSYQYLIPLVVGIPSIGFVYILSLVRAFDGLCV